MLLLVEDILYVVVVVSFVKSIGVDS